MDNNLYPIAIIEDRYNGIYSGGKWIAIANHIEKIGDVIRFELVMLEGNGGDGDSDCFWRNPNVPVPNWVAVGDTPDGALANLRFKNGE